MREFVKPNGIKFKVGSFEWLNFFGLPIGFIIIGFMMLYFYFTKLSTDAIKYLFAFGLLIVIGLITYKIQLKKLSFKSFGFTRNQEDFKNDIRKIFAKYKWEIEYDNKLFMQATQRSTLFNLDMLVLKFTGKDVKWILIHHPGSRNSIAALFSLNRFGKKIIKEIKACV